MVAYADVTVVNGLYNELSQIDGGIAMLDSGGSVSMFMVSPPVMDPAEMPTTPFMMPVQVMIPASSPELVAAARTAMVARHNALVAELAALGVTEAPPVF